MPSLPQDILERAVDVLHQAFDDYYAAFLEITSRGRARFEQQQWEGVVQDAEERIGLYHEHLDKVERAIRVLLDERVADHETWMKLKRAYWVPYLHEYHADLALIFFYSVMRRAFLTAGASVQYSDDEIRIHFDDQPDSSSVAQRTYPERTITSSLIRRMVEDVGFEVPFADLRRDARQAAQALREDLDQPTGAPTIERVEVLMPVFYRNKAAYLIGRICTRSGVLPLIVVLLHGEGGLIIDTVLTQLPDISNVFTSARANFHVEAVAYREVFAFIRSIAPMRSRSFLYASIGFIHPAKLELVKALRHHLEGTAETFRVAHGIPGSVMITFTQPGFPYVFKVIRDRSAKETFQGRDHVRRQYWRVHRMDRVGRMLDIMTFHNLRFPTLLFEPELLRDLLENAASSARIDGDEVVFRYFYAERRIVPLNLYLADDTIPEAHRRRAVHDYGMAIKDLTAAGIFVGDYMTKNFGVNRTGRVILYDYDDIDDLEHWNFRHLPDPPEWAECLAYSDWLSVGAFDVFPEHDFRVFSVPSAYRALFTDTHGDLLTPEYWNGMKDELKAGRYPDYYPYPTEKRLSHRFPD